MKNVKLFLIAALWLALSAPLVAVETSFWQVGSFEDFLQGTLVSVSLSKDGELTLAPEARAIFTPDENLALSLAGDRHENIYVGTGHGGKVFRVDSKGHGSLFFTAPEPDVFALAIGSDGALYAGSSPDGKIYRVLPDGKSTVFYEPKTKYIWALTFDREGRLYAGTGDQGKILRIDKDGKGEVFYDTKQTHVMCMTLDRQGNLLAGTVPNGLIYRFTPQGKAFVIYQSELPEIHALATDAQGRVYAAALGGAGGKGSQEMFGPQGTPAHMPTAVTTVTVTAAAGDDGDQPESNPPAQTAPPANNRNRPPSFNRALTPAVPFPVPKLPQGKGSLIEIQPDYTAETLWTSNTESIFGLAVRGDDVLFSTDSSGRIFDLTPSPDGERLTLLTETREALATRLWLDGKDLYAATTNVAKLFRLGTEPSREGSYESSVKDTKFISHWGTLAYRGEIPSGASIEFFTRSGNTDRPDQTWSDWAGPYRDPSGTAITSPPARYIQWKAVFHGSGAAAPVLDDVTVAYLNQNLPPQIRSLNVSAGGERTGPAGSSPVPATYPGMTVGVVSAAASFGTPSTSSASAKVPITFTWQADDPNGDQLTYALYVKAADENQWHLLKDKMHQTAYQLEPDSIADGKYIARLVASDEDSNPPSTARKTDLVSAPFWVDNTPPAVRPLEPQVKGSEAEVHFEAEDATSPLRSAEASTDGGDWHDVNSDDGIVDSRHEAFTVKTVKLSPGEHVVTLRVYDTAGNAGLGKAVVNVGGGSSASDR
ncbi:MAG TPA: hypothetical protein VG204_14995 [Terriglobia bacterium]|nr:hypothetical protein [Terriglobia bacterium]